MRNCNSLEEVRLNIDRIDELIVKLLSERTHYVAEAAKFKSTTDEVKAPQRVEQVISKVKSLAEKHGADPVLVERIYRMMIDSFINIEMTQYINEKNDK